MGSGTSSSVSSSSPRERSDIVDSEQVVISKASVLFERPLQFAKITKELQQRGGENEKPIVIVAASGAGKSTFVAQLVAKLRSEQTELGQKLRYDIIHSVFIGAVAGSQSLFHVLTELCARLIEDMVDDGGGGGSADITTADDLLGLSGQLECLLNTLGADHEKKILLVIDAVNELDGETARSLFWVPRSPVNVTILLTSIYSDCGGDGDTKKNDDSSVAQVLFALERRFNITVEPQNPLVLSAALSSPLSVNGNLTSDNATILDDLDHVEQVDLLDLLVVGGRKWISGELSRSLRTKKDRRSPLYLKLLADFHVQHPDLTSLDDFPGTIAERFDQILAELESLVPTIGDALSAVLVSSGGMFSSQLVAMIRKDEQTSSRGLASTDSSVVSLMASIVRTTIAYSTEENSPSFVGFVHMQARDAVRRRWLRSSNHVKAIHEKCVAYFETIYADLSSRKPTSPSTVTLLLWRQVLTRLPAHATGTADANLTRQTLCSVAFCFNKCHAGLVSALCNDFSAALERFPQDEDLRDWSECIRQNAHILRPFPSMMLQQALNERNNSSVFRHALLSDAPSTPLEIVTYSAHEGKNKAQQQKQQQQQEEEEEQFRFMWRNKPQTRPVCVATIGGGGHASVFHWTVSAAPVLSFSSSKEEGRENFEYLLAVGSSDGKVRIVDRRIGNEVAVMTGRHKGDVHAVRFHPVDPELVLSVGPGEAVGATDIFVHALATCDLLLSFSVPGVIANVEWNIGEGSQHLVAVVQPTSVSVFTISPPPLSLHDERVVWKTPSALVRKERDEVEGSDNDMQPRCCAFSPKGDKLVVGAGLRLVLCPIVATGKDASPTGAEYTIAKGGHCERINAIDWVNGCIASGGNDFTVCLWSEDAVLLQKVICHTDIVCSVKLSLLREKDGRSGSGGFVLLSTSEDRTACVTTLVSSTKTQSATQPTSPGAANGRGSLSPQHEELAWEVHSRPLRGHGAGVKEGAFVYSMDEAAGCSCDEASLAVTCSDDGSVRVWNLSELKEAAAEDPLFGVNAPITATIWATAKTASAQGEGGCHTANIKTILLVATSAGGLSAFGDAPPPSPLSMVPKWSRTLLSGMASYATITALAVSPSGILGAAALYRRVHVFATQDGAIAQTIEFGDWVNVVAMGSSSWTTSSLGEGADNRGGAAHGVTLAAAGDSAYISVWSSVDERGKSGGGESVLASCASTDLCTHTPSFLLTHSEASASDSVLSLSLTSSCSLIASGANDNVVRVWAMPSAASKDHSAAGSSQNQAAPPSCSSGVDVGAWVISLAFVQRAGEGQQLGKQSEYLLAAGTAGRGGGIVLLRCRYSEEASPTPELSTLAEVRVGCSIAWCEWCFTGKEGEGESMSLITTSEAKLVQVWRCRCKSEGDEERAQLEMSGVFSAVARFGSPDGVGGQGGCQNHGSDTIIAVGDESGRLYILSLESGDHRRRAVAAAGGSGEMVNMGS